MAKYLITMVSCKKDSNHVMQSWIMPHCIIHSVCSHCGARTSSGHEHYDEHYDLYEIVVKKNPKESYEDMFDRGRRTIMENPAAHKVQEFMDQDLLLMKKTKTKE